MGRVCDYCSTAKAVIFCRADSARLCLACDKQVRQLPAPITAKTRFNHGTVGMGEIPVDAPNRGARSRSTRRCERPLDASRSILTDGGIRVGAKRAFFASSRDARRVLASAPREETTPPLRSFSHPLSVSALLSGAHGESGGAETRPLMVM